MSNRSKNEHVVSSDGLSLAMSALLPVHAATTLDGLVDATAVAAERMLSAAHTLLYLEDAEGNLERKAPASDTGRRTLQRAVDAFGEGVLRARIEPDDAPGIAEALIAPEPVPATAADLLRGLAGDAAATAAQTRLGVESLALVPLESGGARIGALLLMFTRHAEPASVRLFADHVSRAATNLVPHPAARGEQGIIDVVRSVFDARKLETDLQKELSRAVRYHREVAIAVIEATNLRLLRERFGRVLTDQMLQRLGAALARSSREIDVIGAYKESGYTMILTEASAEAAAAAAARLLAIAQDVTPASDAVPGLELHLACGWASCPGDGATTDQLFAEAERRMYDPAEEVA